MENKDFTEGKRDSALKVLIETAMNSANKNNTRGLNVLLEFLRISDLKIEALKKFNAMEKINPALVKELKAVINKAERGNY